MKKERNTFWEIPHDSWTVHKYGTGYKVTYFKKGRRSSLYKQEQLFDDENITSEEGRFSQSLSRTKSTIFELAMCNEFTFFCTFTQNKDLVDDRFDLNAFRKDFSQFIRNQNRSRDTKIKYLLIPEQHKNGAWHLHGLISGLLPSDLRPFSLDEHLPNSIRKQLKQGKIVYNWEKYSKKFGFFTATEIISHEACSRYITKYITKDILKTNIEAHGHTFFASKGLNRKELVSREKEVRCPLEKWDFENDYIKTKWFSSEEEIQEAFTKNYQ